MLYATLGTLLDALGHRWDGTAFWCVVGLFWASETLTRVELVEQIQQELDALRRRLQGRKENAND